MLTKKRRQENEKTIRFFENLTWGEVARLQAIGDEESDRRIDQLLTNLEHERARLRRNAS